MSVRTENSNAQNIAAFKSLVELAKSFGNRYQPANQAITNDGLSLILSDLDIIYDKYQKARVAYATAVDKQQTEFSTLSALVRRVENAFKATAATPAAIETLRTITRPLLGYRSKAPATAQSDKDATPVKRISTSQLGYANRISNFKSMIEMVKLEPSYSPNEAVLKVAALENTFITLNSLTEALATASYELSKRRNELNLFLYDPNAGLADYTRRIKAYVKSVFGTSSPESKKMTSITFYNRKISPSILR